LGIYIFYPGVLISYFYLINNALPPKEIAGGRQHPASKRNSRGSQGGGSPLPPKCGAIRMSVFPKILDNCYKKTLNYAIRSGV